jgi:signal transduction histidine kinase
VYVESPGKPMPETHGSPYAFRVSRAVAIPRRLFRAVKGHRRDVLDWAIVAALVLPILIGGLLQSGRDGMWAIPFQVAACATVKWRRRRPLTVLAVVTAATVLQVTTGVRDNGLGAATLVAVYSAMGYAPRRKAGFALAATAAVLLAASFSPWARTDNSRVSEGVLLVVAALIGDNRRSRRAYVAGVEERAARLERERETQAQIAVAEERTRIAREMHDVVAHSLAVMVAQADGAAYVVDNAPGEARAAIETVAETGRSALSEMHRLLGILRADEQDGMAPQPGVGQLDALIARTQSAGLPVTLTVQGAPAELSPGLSLTVYRIVQEALTNTLKHAGPAVSARVQLRYDDEAVEIDVDDDGAAPRGAMPAADGEGGHGLTGMRERTAVYGGSLQAGPRPGRGWRIHARLPLEVGR